MANEKNVLIRFTAESGGLDESTQKIDELRAKNKELWADYDKAQEARKKAASSGSAVEQKSMQEQYDAIRKVTSEIEKNEKQIKKLSGEGVKNVKRLSDAFKKVPESIPEKAVEKSFRTIKREIENQIKSMEMLGKTGTAEYQKLIKEAGRLADIESDVARQIKGIASDTAGFDLIMEGTQGIAAGFQVAQGAAALFGVEQEKLMPMMVKLQALMALTTGLQQIQNNIQKESYVMRAVSNLQLSAATKAEAAHARAIAIKTSAEKGSVLALGKATIAQKAFNLVAKANPYVLLATALISVVGALALLTKANKAHNIEQKRMNDLNKAAIDGYNEQQVELEMMSRKIKLNTTSLDEKQKMLKVVNEKYLDSKNQLKDVNELEEWLVNATPAVVQAYIARATADAARAKAVETNMKLLEDQQKSDEEVLKWYDKAIAGIYGLFGDADELRRRRAGYYREQNKQDFEAEKNFYINTAIEMGNQASELFKTLGLKTGDEIGNISKDSAKKIAFWQKEQYKQDQAEFEKSLHEKRAIKEIEVKKELAIDKERAEQIAKEQRERLEREIELEREAAERKREIQMASLDFARDFGNTLFSINSDRLQAELSDLEHYYTTDAEEARKNKDKKLISEKELAAKKLEIKRKQAQADKLEGIFNIGIATAQSIMNSAKMGFPAAIPFIAMAAALGAVQLAAVVSKPLPKYWKGRKGGKGELAMVGEHGPEMMWIPNGASVVPAHVSKDVIKNNRYDLLKNWNIPNVYNIELPRISKETIRETKEFQRQNSIDYDLLGRSVAKHIRIPQSVERNVNITVDKDGVHIDDTGGNRTFRNRKYKGQWN
ncbi:hypothetical protein [Proteiniphilum sp. X52]|uniref:hypothetical protein n=1 Tax=Proteiniphilum sp. X52 TaxID=2382159 RepID=UPI000F0A0974|nr:hypothetical protein [Proteiniphilum sp. X52]RNC66465.1 hypothetical protein D7D25_03015 [Proteiniphilum sp. X52]